MVGYFIQTGALVYYFQVVIGSTTLSVTVATIMSVVPMIANFFVPFLASKMGKRNLYIVSSIVQLLGCALIFLAGNHSLEILIGAVVSGLGYGIKESIYFSMQADPVDYGIWKTGINVSGSLSAINGFLGKVAQAIAGGVAGALLAWGSYNPNKAIQSEQAVLAIKAMYLYVPMLLILCSIVTMLFYRLDTMYPMIEKELAEGKTQSDQG